MNDPIKIIHRYNNNEKRVQYQIHIFLGDIVDNSCMKILNKIKDLDLYNSLISLDENERDILNKAYGEYWYEHFFNNYHINNTKTLLLKNATRRKELQDIYGKQWLEDHIINFQKRILTTTFNYEYVHRRTMQRKNLQKIIKKQREEKDELVDYTIMGQSSISNFPTADHVNELDNTEFSLDRIKGECSDDSSDSDEPEFELSESDEIEQIGGDNGEESDMEFGEIAVNESDFTPIMDDENIKQFEEEESKDLENLDLIFNELDTVDHNIKVTTREIKKAIGEKKYDKMKKINDFDTSKDTNLFDENLKDVYEKHYIIDQYIYRDDTIKTIRNKICSAIKNNPKFGDAYFIPSYQYLWSEYFYNDQIQKVMIGQKWTIRNDILKIDIETNTNLSVYEELRGNLRMLRDNIKRHGKIKWEDDDNNILDDYQDFMLYNELYMIDIYNELGLNYEPNFEELRNLIDVYVKIYFPKIRTDEFRNIIEFLNPNRTQAIYSSEISKMKMIFETLSTELILENEIMKQVELTKKKSENQYRKIFLENFVTQSFVRVYLLDKPKRINLFRIFDNFLLDEVYPFIQYMPSEGTPHYRYNQQYLIENERKEIITKWFEHSFYGISFKIRTIVNSEYKYMTINLSDNGRIDYKIQWKEEDMSTVADINNTYKSIYNLIDKINAENGKFGINFEIPEEDSFKIAFINTIQKLQLPNNFSINHNDLSEFSRYFFPYISMVIEPRKRVSKQKGEKKEEKSKFGTYLRYKRISKYENKAKIEHRIIFFMRNYEYNDQSLASEISKEFNITEEQAFGEIETVRQKYPNIKPSRKILKKMENIPKYKSPGIEVSIQGKTRNKYKLKISGSRSIEQLNRIITFMNILIYLYMETYLYKKANRQPLKEMLKKLTNIARRRNKVDEVVDYESTIKSIKEMKSLDRKRLGYKGNEDQHQWTRYCQNSGDDKRRRPQSFLSVENLQQKGYVWKETLNGFQFGHYEKTIMVDEDGNTDSNKKKKKVSLRAVKLSMDDSGENFIYYTCDPEENGKHMYVGFLNKSINPYGEPMPCCFIKDHFYSKNEDKRNFYLNSIGILQDEPNLNKIAGEQLYILQDTNKIQPGRLAFLPKYLDIFVNFLLGKTRELKNHYLLKTDTGFYFKYGAKQDDNRYLHALEAVLDISIDQLKEKMVMALKNDKKNAIFTSLNNGDIRTQFGDINIYINYIKNNEYLDHSLVNDILGIPGIITDYGINVFIFEKEVRIIKKALEKEKIKESYYLICQNLENNDNLFDPNKDSIFIIKDHQNYYPIVMVLKEEHSKEIKIIKTFNYDQEPDNVINHVLKYYLVNCQSEYQLLIDNETKEIRTAKETAKILFNLNNKDFKPKSQIIDARYKCIYLITQNKSIIPTLPSGSIYDLKIDNNINQYIQSYQDTYRYLNLLDNLTNQQLGLKPIGVYYSDNRGKNYLVTGIMTKNSVSVPVKDENITSQMLKKNNLIAKNKSLDDLINKEISKGKSNVIIDQRIFSVSKNKYDVELYQLFRYHLSYYLNNVFQGLQIKDQIQGIINDSSINKNIKRIEIKKILYKLSNSELSKTYINLINSMRSTAGIKKRAPVEGKENLDIYKYHVLSEANEPLQVVEEPPSIEIIPEDFDVRDRRDVSNLKYETQSVPKDLKIKAAAPPATPKFVKNNPSIIKNKSTKKGKWINLLPDNKDINYPSFVLKNIRELCYIANKNNCQESQYCHWNKSNDTCTLSIKRESLIDYINRVTEEFVQNELKASEILQIDDYFVSDIVSYHIYTERPNEKVILASNVNIDKILKEIFGDGMIPKIGKRHNKLEIMHNYNQLNINNPIIKIDNWYLQYIIDDNNTIFRAFSNAYYWLLHPYNNLIVRNLGYYSATQTELSNIYKSQVIEWLLLPENDGEIKKMAVQTDQKKLFDIIINLSMNTQTMTNFLIELFALSKINETIIYVFDENFRIIFAFHPIDGLIYNHQKNDKLFDQDKYSNYKKIIYLRFLYLYKNIFPDKVEAVYPIEK